jgi:hypothetical protein
MSYNILDGIAKFEYDRYLNIGGAMLVPSERGELSRPFFQATHDAFKTPFFPQDFSTKFGSGGSGRYGRDDGGTFRRSVEPRFIKATPDYAIGVYSGLQPSSTLGPNQGDDVLWAGRFTYNFPNPEKNPGYYTGSTASARPGYPRLALAFGASYQKNGAGFICQSQRFSWAGWRRAFRNGATQESGCGYRRWRVQAVLRQLFAGRIC